MMGFNKRYVIVEIFIENYEKDGIEGIINYIGKSDAIIGDDIVNQILETIESNDCNIKKEVKIDNIILEWQKKEIV